jgi:TetR/AcrR family transcriptional regulator, regulator of cefoperazone and chloramphenicol sensitivity
LKRSKSKHHDHGTRVRLLEVAGQVFAEKGFAGATGKEICRRARVNVAAINYHYRGLDNLYDAVLREAVGRLPSAGMLRKVLSGETDPKAKLAAILDFASKAISGPLSSSWVIRVVGREAVNPSPAFVALQKKETRPKLVLLKDVIAEIMELPPGHPAVERGCVSVIAPCSLLLLGKRYWLKQVFPHFGFEPEDSGALSGHLTRFSLAGLAAIAADAKDAKASDRLGSV